MTSISHNHRQIINGIPHSLLEFIIRQFPVFVVICCGVIWIIRVITISATAGTGGTIWRIWFWLWRTWFSWCLWRRGLFRCWRLGRFRLLLFFSCFFASNTEIYFSWISFCGTILQLSYSVNASIYLTAFETLLGRHHGDKDNTSIFVLSNIFNIQNIIYPIFSILSKGGI